MDWSNRIELGITDTRKIISVIKDNHGYDYKNYALTFFKHRLEKVIEKHNLRDAEGLIEKLEEGGGFFEKFVQDVSVETTELFRNPSLWRIIRDEFLPRQLKSHNRFKIWLANCQTGEELYSMAIMIEEAELWDRVEIFASYDSDRNYELIKSGKFGLHKLETNEANYKRFNCFEELSRYYEIKNNAGYWDTSLIKKIKFSKQNITFDSSLGHFNLVWFRNQMIYYNQSLQDHVLRIIYDSLYPSGHLVTGEKESVANSSLNKQFRSINDNEKIYKKI